MKRSANGACLSCRKKKIKCDGSYPCGQCINRSMECEYQEPKKRGPKSGLLKQLKEENEKLKEFIFQTKTDLLSEFHKNLHKLESSSTLSLEWQPSPLQTETIEGGFPLTREHFLLIRTFFQYVNSVLPFVNETRFYDMESQRDATAESAHQMQLYAILAIMSNISLERQKAEKFAEVAMKLAQKLYDSPSEEVTSGFSLISYYHFGCGRKTKASINLTIANQMAKEIKISDEMKLTLYILSFFMLPSENSIPLFRSNRWLLEADESPESPSKSRIQFYHILIYASARLLQNDASLFQEQHQLLDLIEKAFHIIKKETWGGPMNFSLTASVYGLKAWLFERVGNTTLAKENAELATTTLINELNIFCGPCTARTCIFLARLHRSYGQMAMYSLDYQILTQMASRWSFLQENLKQFDLPAISSTNSITTSNHASALIAEENETESEIPTFHQEYSSRQETDQSRDSDDASEEIFPYEEDARTLRIANEIFNFSEQQGNEHHLWQEYIK